MPRQPNPRRAGANQCPPYPPNRNQPVRSRKIPKRTVQETIEYFEQLASEFEKKSHREQDELTKAQYAAKAEAYELAAFELKRNCDY